MSTEPQQPKELRILNLGAGVQSTTVALMAGTVPEIPMFDCAVFADTGDEPKAVYSHLEWLSKQLSFPIHVRSAGRLSDDLRRGRNSSGGSMASIPAFTSARPGESEGMTRRQCTKEYKTEVVERTIKRELLKLPPRVRVRENVHQYLGLSYDEVGRIARVRAVFASKVKWSTPHFPLFEMEMTRRDCLAWLKPRVPHQVPRSACIFCPFHSNAEWRRIRDETPDEWAFACQVDREIKDIANSSAKFHEHKLYLHRSCLPLDQAPIDDAVSLGLQPEFAMECEGMCGL